MRKALISLDLWCYALCNARAFYLYHVRVLIYADARESDMYIRISSLQQN